MTQQQRERKVLIDNMFALSFHPSEWWLRDDDKHDAKTSGGGIKSMWVYREMERGTLWTVGFYDPNKAWHADSDHTTKEEAAVRCNWLNGGSGGKS